MRRREFMGAGLLAASLAGLSKASYPLTLRPLTDYPDEPGTLASRAAARGLLFGTAVKSATLQTDPRYAALVAQQAGVLVAEYEMKWDVIAAQPDRYDFAPGDAILAFARKNGQRMRGHTLCWYAVNPAWVEQKMRDPSIDRATKAKLLTGYIDTVARRYSGKMIHWDVVNEPIDPSEGRPDGMRVKNIWSEALGETYIDMAFHAAREADPHAVLYLNEFGIESDIPWNEAKRTALLKLLDRLKGRGVPIQGLGIQSHLQPYKARFDERIFRDFLEKVTGYGLKLSVTELDLSDRALTKDSNEPEPARRDNQVAAVAKAFLDVALSFKQTEAVLCWGLSDKYSWLSSRWAKDRWPEGSFARGLPYTSDLREKKLYRAIGAAFDAAPDRSMIV